MLKKVRDLGDSLTKGQIDKLKEILGPELYNLLDLAFESETDDEVDERISSFVNEAKRKPLKIIKARKILTDEQKSVIIEFLD